jgi:hypothetical protein
MIIEYDGVKYLVTNWDEFKKQLLYQVGVQLAQEVEAQVDKIGIISTGEFKNAIAHPNNILVSGDEVTLINPKEYGYYLEYGTAGTRRGVIDPFGENTRGANPDRKMPMDKNKGGKELVPSLQDWARHHGIKKSGYWGLAKHIQMYGMKPYAPYRKVFYNTTILERAVSNASRGSLSTQARL